MRRRRKEECSGEHEFGEFGMQGFFHELGQTIADYSMEGNGVCQQDIIFMCIVLLFASLLLMRDTV
jgi:hypothetical protein